MRNSDMVEILETIDGTMEGSTFMLFDFSEDI